MSKYDALWRYLQTSGQTQLTLTFDEIAALAGTALDHSFLTCKKELWAETPFTLAGAKELQRLGILALAIPLGSSLLGSIAEGLAAGLLNTETATAAELYFDNEASLVLGLMFLLGSLLCRYGAEQKEA